MWSLPCVHVQSQLVRPSLCVALSRLIQGRIFRIFAILSLCHFLPLNFENVTAHLLLTKKSATSASISDLNRLSASGSSVSRRAFRLEWFLRFSGSCLFCIGLHGFHGILWFDGLAVASDTTWRPHSLPSSSSSLSALRLWIFPSVWFRFFSYVRRNPEPENTRPRPDHK